MPNPYNFNHDYFDTIGENQAYILGLLFTDGCHRATVNQIIVKLQIRDKEVLEKIKQELRFDGPISVVKTWNPAWQDLASLSFSNKHTSTRLLALGLLPAKSLILMYPNWLTHETERHFIRGCIDGDGHISKMNGLVFVGTESMCLGIAEAFMRNCQGIARVTKRSRGSNTYQLKLGVRTGLAKVLDWLYSNSILYIDRKYNAAMERIENQICKEQPRLCSIVGCRDTVYGLGLCLSHYRKERYITRSSPKFAHSALCSLEGCDRTLYAKGLCSKHYQHQRLAINNSVSDELCACARTR